MIQQFGVRMYSVSLRKCIVEQAWLDHASGSSQLVGTCRLSSCWFALSLEQENMQIQHPSFFQCTCVDEKTFDGRFCLTIGIHYKFIVVQT